ncbi:MAG: protein translocase subunit SecDF [Solitalea-like symbiont of Tyrophagus putrescentiae]
MHSKSLIKTIAFFLTIACLYHLSFTFIARKVENDATKFSNGDMAKKTQYLDSVANKTVYNLGIARYTYNEVKERQLNLGLDLKGGMNITMAVSMEDLLKSLCNNEGDPKFIKALRLAKERAKGSIKNFVDVFAESYQAQSPDARLAPLFATSSNQNEIDLNANNTQVVAYLHREVDAAIDRTFNILRTRIDKFGIAQPNIQKAGNGRILIELPGVTDQARVRKLVQGAAKLEFWETYDNAEIFTLLNNINSRLKDKLKIASDTVTVDKSKTQAKTKKTDKSSNSKQSLVDKLANSGDIAKLETEKTNNPLFNILTPHLSFDPETYGRPINGPIVGYAQANNIEQINKYLSEEENKNLLPFNLHFSWSANTIGDQKDIYTLYALKGKGFDNSAVLDGEYVINSRAGINEMNGQPEVVMFMNSEGANIWRRITSEAAKNQSAIAIVLDGVVYSAPRVNNEIPNGVSSITGHFTIDETTDLANILKAGKLPAPVYVEEEAVVGPTLGQESMQAGLVSCIFGLLAVFVFIWFYYNKAGLIANVALIINLFFMIGILASFQAVLTLPGIAGIILTMGMAVDANVIIYERIKEELNLNNSLSVAVNKGFKHAYSAIIDANVTTLLLGIVLYIFSSGIVKGFATTLIIGIFTSMFTAIYMTRLMIESFLKKKQDLSFSTKITKSWFNNVNFNFVGKRKLFYSISIVIIIIGMISLIFRGLNIGVDFKGGRSYVVRFDNNVKVSEVRKVLTPLFAKETPEIKTFGSTNQVKVTTSYLIDDESEYADREVKKLLEIGLSKINNKSEILSTQKIGPTIAKDIKIGAYYSIIISLLVMYAYILLRFKRWQLSVGAVVALIHDVLIMVSIYSIFNGLMPFQLDVNQTFIAALLTIMGYSMNDTVVIFDRIREYYSKFSNKKLIPQIVNLALNSTLNRTLVTALTTAVVLVVMLLFGGETLASFSFAMLVGVIAGTYSSIFIANVGLLDLDKKQPHEALIDEIV